MSFCMVASWPSCTWPALQCFQGGWCETGVGHAGVGWGWGVRALDECVGGMGGAAEVAGVTGVAGVTEEVEVWGR